MKVQFKTRFALGSMAATLIAAGALVGCGGGGGPSPSTNTAAQPTSPVVASNLVLSVPTATYAGETAKAYALLNAERSACGFGLLTQNAQLDAAAQSHADYLILNKTSGHSEVSGTPGFTGVIPFDRAKAMGYAAGGVSEVASAELAGMAGAGEHAVRRFLSAPYHMAVVLAGLRDVGMSIRNPSDIGSTSTSAPVVFNFGYLSSVGMQAMASGEVRTYPCDGSVGVFPSLRGESPNPVPGRDLGVNPIGAPIMVVGRPEATVAITNATMMKIATGATIALRAPVTAANDPNGALLIGFSYVAPEAPLEPYTRYQVTVNGTNDGIAFSRTFPFTTGAN